MANNIEGKKWLHIGGITDGGVRRLTLSADRTYIQGNLGIGSTAPQSRLQVRSLTAIDEGATAAGAWANFGSNAFHDGAWKRIDSTKAGVNLHMNPDGAGQEFRFLRQEADGTSLRNIAVIGSATSFIAEGNVGIGTTGPQGKLDVRGAIRAGNSDIYFTEPNHNHTGIGNTAGFAAIENTANYGALMILGRAGTSRGRYVRLWDYLQVNGGMDVTGNVEFLSASNPIRVSSGWTGFPDAVTNQAEISNDTGTYKTLMIVGNRSAGVGRRVSVWDRLEVNGSAFKPGGGSWSSISDVRVKKSVMPLKGALEKLSRLRGVSFEWKNPEEQGNLTGTQIGLVAQEVEEVFPEWISTDPSGYKNLTIRGFEALTIEAFRELKAENEMLTMKNEELEDRIKVLELTISGRQPSGNRNGAVR
jgi:hypothetical protein